ncbi:hypothetical protein NAPIS_ORF00536 [Vairimorpha apis BRL 01]|uniref:Uncharacterized protein n=1 Tax=Vairimorpha apis BRL 01 TaxID=1037528 RepID=T0MFM1_9MICR|nr:hypothetical protein NAPIS_ORF00536 [Vairimorpha apis BRL 01]
MLKNDAGEEEVGALCKNPKGLTINKECEEETMKSNLINILKKLEYPHWLPCSHKKRNFCPLCFQCPFSVSDLRTYEKQYEYIKKMPVILFTNEIKLKKELKKYRFEINVNRHVLEQRYKEMCINVEFERFKKIPRNYNTIVRHICQNEIMKNLIIKKNEDDFKKQK